MTARVKINFNPEYKSPRASRRFKAAFYMGRCGSKKGSPAAPFYASNKPALPEQRLDLAEGGRRDAGGRVERRNIIRYSSLLQARSNNIAGPRKHENKKSRL